MDKNLTKWFYIQPFLFTKESIHLLEISRKLKKNHATIRNHLNEFVKEGFLKMENKGRLTLYKINNEFPLFIDYISIAEKEFLIQKCSKNNILKELISDLHKISKKPMILFGSIVEDYNKAEDIDIITLEYIDFKKLENKYNKEFHNIKIKDLTDIKPALKEEIYKKHIIINGVEETLKWLI
jgi:hypothetical protein